MNQKQREYAIERVRALRGKRILALKEKYITPAKRLSRQEKFELVRSGKVKVRNENEDFAPHYWVDLFDFSKFEAEAKAHPKFDEFVDAEKARAQKVIDEIMLGDAEEALNLIRVYEGPA